LVLAVLFLALEQVLFLVLLVLQVAVTLEIKALRILAVVLETPEALVVVETATLAPVVREFLVKVMQAAQDFLQTTTLVAVVAQEQLG
jgi:hypothetical protein